MAIQIQGHTLSQEHKAQGEQARPTPSTFPVLPDASYCNKKAERVLSSQRIQLELEVSGPVSSTLQLAWALVIAAYTDSNNAEFDLCIVGVPTLAVYLRCFSFVIQPDHTVVEALASLSSATAAMAQFDSGPVMISPCQTHNNMLVIQHNPREPADLSYKSEKLSAPLLDRYPLTITAEIIAKVGISLHIRSDPAIISPAMGQIILDQLAHAVRRIQLSPNDGLESLLGISVDGLKQLQIWNSHLPLQLKHQCIHEIFEKRAQENPSAPAICAWDGSLTYQELDLESTSLAECLMSHSDEPEKFVGLFLEKSMWTAVSMLAVLKVGSAFVLLDPCLPDLRLQSLCRISQAAIIITTEKISARARYLGPPVIVVDDRSQRRATFSSSSLPAANSNRIAYAAFTSGSSGEPKGVVVEHWAVSSGVEAYCSKIALNHRSRVFQFASYSFTISIVDHLVALMQGACLCIPSTTQLKESLLDTMLAFNVNWMTVTPSVARVLDPKSIPGLKTLCLAGESLTRSDLEKWYGRVDLKSIYGQTENTLAALVDTKTKHSFPSDLGYAFAAHCWVVHPHDHNRLVPIGAEGELLLEAPTLARGYLNNKEQTRDVFIYDPLWLRDTCRLGEQRRRFLKTGDIVRYRPEDGSLQYVGRKGTQVKLRGQRVELTEVEFQLRRQFPIANAVIAEIVTFDEEQTQDAILVAFIAISSSASSSFCSSLSSSSSPLFAKLTSAFADQSQQALDRLRDILPEYMVPTTVVPISTVPLTQSGKLNRRLLRNAASKMGSRLLAYHILVKKAYRPPKTDKELTLQRICAGILRLKPTDINMDETFFTLGGNSISTMQLVDQARDAGLAFAVSDVYRQQSLAALAEHEGKRPSATSKSIVPANESISIAATKAKLMRQRGAEGGRRGFVTADFERIVDIFPCTETQQWMLGTNEGGYFLLHFSGQLDTGRLESACHRLVSSHTALRSVFVRLDGILSQAVLKDIDLPFVIHSEPSSIQDPTSLARELCRADGADEDPFPLGVLPLRFTLVRGGGEKKGSEQHVLIIRLSHAQYDGICQHSIVSDLCTFYRQSPDPEPSTDFALYAREMARRQTPEAFAFWRGLLDGSNIPRMSFVVPKRLTKNTLLRCSAKIAVPTPPVGITMASVVKAAWSSVLREVTGDNDVVFGQLVNMRGMDSPGIYRIVGPCYNITPVRLQYQSFKSILDLLHATQDQHVLCMPFETAEWDRVVSNSSNWPLGTRPHSIVVHQNFPRTMDIQMDGLRCQLADYIPLEPMDMSLDLYSEPSNENLTLTLISSSHFMTIQDVEAVLEMLCKNLLHFTTTPESSLCDVTARKPSSVTHASINS